MVICSMVCRENRVDLEAFPHALMAEPPNFQRDDWNSPLVQQILTALTNFLECMNKPSVISFMNKSTFERNQLVAG